jgi:hypothetical protein
MSPLSWVYIAIAAPIWRRLLMHCVIVAFCLDRIKEGKSMLAKMEMIAMTTSNSISVKAARNLL